MDAGGVGARVAEVAALRSLTLTATIGTVAIEGPAGVADATPHAFAPAGWDRVRGALTFDASANRLDANIAIGGGTLRRPLLVVRGRSAGLPATPRLGGATLVQDVDDFPSPRAAAGELWIASACDLAGAVNRIEIPP